MLNIRPIRVIGLTARSTEQQTIFAPTFQLVAICMLVIGGEAIKFISSSDTTLTNSFHSWYTELKHLGQYMLILDCSNHDHFTEVAGIWSKSWVVPSELKLLLSSLAAMNGIKYEAGNFDMYLVCSFYKPSADVLGRQIYEPGPSASNCPANTNPDSVRGLCEIADS
ncbi:SCP extracellular domain containing protein [Aphelenchoides besseyi]|nr:SCP extracellular domain containing protein [Aphelenchoides besseyi]KAI6198586.1 SCP extracellular domain containing protein [Aphelenchoides besseyi]